MSIIAPSPEAQAATGTRLQAARAAAKPCTPDDILDLERDWTRDGMHHHMGATDTIHRLLATIATLRS